MIPKLVSDESFLANNNGELKETILCRNSQDEKDQFMQSVVSSKYNGSMYRDYYATR